MFGRSRQHKTITPAGEVKIRSEKVAMEDWEVCIPDHHHGYFSWDDFLATRER